MKDKDFDEIGKRLYDLEADPPKDGWDKVGAALNAPPKSGKVVWLKKNWWKPLALLIVPVTFYALYETQTIDGQNLNASSSISAIQDDTSNEDVEEVEFDRVEQGTDNNLSAEESAQNSSSPIQPGSTQSQGSKLKSHPDNEDTNTKITDHSASNNEKKQSKRSEKNITDDKDNSIDTPVVQNDLTSLSATSGSISNSVEHHDIAASGIVLSPQSPDINHQETLNQATEAPDHPDSVALIEQKKNDELAQGVPKEDTIILEDNSRKGWRIVASFSPLFISSTSKPVINDDILVTNVKSSSPEKIGFELAIGGGKQITKNLFLDGMLTYMETEQKTFYSYSTGQVDTLIATQLPDQSVQVTPIYVVNNAEVIGKYSYGGLKLAGTYYFWDNSRRRFNVTTSLGAYYLIGANVKEKINDRWITLSNDGVNKMNYSLTLGVGYNKYLHRGWELMINPNMTFYSGKSNYEQLPYNQSQRSLGLNFMLSKTLAIKK